MPDELRKIRFCLNCGREIEQNPKRKPKKYCCDKCRVNYWRMQRESELNEKPHPEDAHVCLCCGKTFFAYSQKNRKYCSHECYMAARFGNGMTSSESQEKLPAGRNNKDCIKGIEKPVPVTELQTRDFDGGAAKKRSKEISEEELKRYRSNPYVKRAGFGRIEPERSFYKEGSPLLDAGIDSILSAFEMEPANFTDQEKWLFKGLMEKEAEHPRETENPPEYVSDVHMRIMANRNLLMNHILEDKFRSIGNRIKEMSTGERKEICRMISGMPKDPAGVFTVSRMISLCGISRNSYYCYVRDDRYGLSIDERDSLDEPDVRMAFEYKGYKKGVRMVYMLIPVLTGRKIGIDRVRRIMRKYGMDSGVRKANGSRRAAAKRLAEYRKPNLLRRMFRLHRPNEVRITDVTCLEYGAGRKAYGSALMDPVTGVLVAFVVSEHNDLELAKETLRRTDSHPCRDGGIFHSDQGSLYLSPEFQKEVAALGFVQSMSKRGNCWDNAPQESFFGHFKDECDYSGCRDTGELRKIIDGYAFYYNHERGLWDRQHMTPIKYEEYLLSLSEEEFAGYMAHEEEKYIAMKESSAVKAKERFHTLGV